MNQRHIEKIAVQDIEKRRIPSKYYVYVVHVRWSDGVESVVYRRYSKFFDLQVSNHLNQKETILNVISIAWKHIESYFVYCLEE